MFARAQGARTHSLLIGRDTFGVREIRDAQREQRVTERTISSDGMPTLIERLSEPPAACLGALIAESERDGLRFVRRLAEEWTSGANRFDKPGEALFVARRAGHVVGVCGLNVDPYAPTPNVGRVRHLYVLAAHRRHGVGGQLVAKVIRTARGRFEALRLRTGNPAAAGLYERLGFRRRADVADCSHVLELSRRALLAAAYDAFNTRDVERALATMHPEVEWPNGMEGGYVHGHDEVREYWTRQWRLIDPHVEPRGFATDDAGRVVVDVHQVVRDPAGTTLADRMVRHIYTIEGGLIRRMEIRA
jgi:GNAT superfamily N-acetyltransferase